MQEESNRGKVPMEAPTPKILIVDDEVRLTQSLDSLVRAMGLISRTAHSGYDAQKLLDHEEFDLVVTDLIMPGISGMDLIEFIRERGLLAPVIVLTGEGTVKAAVEALKRGAYDFVVKPFEPERFRNVLRNGLEKNSFERKRMEQMRHAEQLQEELRQSKQYLELVLQSAEDVAIITTNRDGHVKTLNTGASKLLQASLDQALGRPIMELFSNQDVLRISEEFLKGKRLEPWSEDVLLQNQRGDQLWVHVVMRWMESASPSLAGLILVATDITKLRLLRERLQFLSITDDLTGLYNQRYFYESLHREIDRSNRKNSFFGLILFDIDHFKRYNDEFGHLKGDAILEGVGDVVRSTIRKIDFGFRYGGDEFAVLLPETEIENALVIAERVRVNGLSHSEGAVTFSIGVVQGCARCDERLLIEAVDKAMYEAKRMGGNNVFSAGNALSLKTT
jgi:diguanylate cyclase (GGDEF)-like protein/PAS domain S-box-containing protein